MTGTSSPDPGLHLPARSRLPRLSPVLPPISIPTDLPPFIATIVVSLLASNLDRRSHILSSCLLFCSATSLPFLIGPSRFALCPSSSLVNTPGSHLVLPSRAVQVPPRPSRLAHPVSPRLAHPASPRLASPHPASSRLASPLPISRPVPYKDAVHPDLPVSSRIGLASARKRLTPMDLYQSPGNTRSSWSRNRSSCRPSSWRSCANGGTSTGHQDSEGAVGQVFCIPSIFRRADFGLLPPSLTTCPPPPECSAHITYP